MARPALPQLITLVPQSGIQFLDLPLALDRLPRTTLYFHEQRLPGEPEPGRMPVALRRLLPDEDGRLRDPETGREVPAEDGYAIGRPLAAETFMGRWVPLPLFRLRARNPDGTEAFDRGPSNWARARLVALPQADEDGFAHRLIVALDTTLIPREPDRPYTGLAPEDGEKEFAFALRQDPASWFLNEAWVAQWLDEVFRESKLARRQGRALRPEDTPWVTEPWARYLAFLSLLEDAAILPRIRCIDVTSTSRAYEPIGVDLVLDIGNARTCGVLVEDRGREGGAAGDAYQLVLRDLTFPERLYRDPFDSRVEFARASFGKDALSRRSGRGNAFAWGSPVRVGPEAVRLAAEAKGNEGATGLSSPKRYLWDRRPTAQVWRFNGVGADGITTEPPVSGSFMRFVTEEGDVLRARGVRGGPAVRARFSRSSLFGFLLAELLMQAVVQINAPENRLARTWSDVPRRLRRLVLTLPPSMPLAEQKILRARAEAAVKLAWDMLGWPEGAPASPPEPRVVANLDEATATQLVFLYAEATQRLKGDLDALFTLSGRVRPGHGPKPCLRLASIDIGGGTTDLMVATYRAEPGGAIEPKQNFREGFKIAGDEVLQQTLQAVLLPQLEAALRDAGLPDAKAFLRELLGGERGGLPEPEKHLRRQFVALALEPLGLAILHGYEAIPPRAAGEFLRATAGELLARAPATSPRAIAYVEEQAARRGARSFRLAEVPIAATAAQLDQVVIAALGPVLADLCEVVFRMGCDWLLLSGRPSRLRAVMDIILAKLPVPAHRVMALDRFRVGRWYPFRDAAERIADPKTTAAVGAVLATLAEGRLEGFLLRSSRFAMRSTARYMGLMQHTGQIRDADLFPVDLDRAPKEAPVEVRLTFGAPGFIGFRQLPLERWRATPLYWLDYANPANVADLALPLAIAIERAELDIEDADSGRAPDEAKREEFRITEILNARGDPVHPRLVEMRLQTLKDSAGYWRDTGALEVP
jgi:hypothetical protein